ncbi:MAG TPA: hypothetical protein EYP54_06835 [Anaerolineales bacterium]|nr:hypothetical protein [Anaerolineales bacterium]
MAARLNLRRWGYRAWQVLVTLHSKPDTEGLAAAREALPPALWGLFRALPLNEQAHGLRVWRAVGGPAAPPEVQMAALLHDAGKALTHIALWERIVAVLGRALTPRLARRLARGAPRGLRRPFVIAAQHPAWSAALAQAAGAPPEAVRLIARHQTPPQADDFWLQRLQAADDRS